MALTARDECGDPIGTEQLPPCRFWRGRGEVWQGQCLADRGLDHRSAARQLTAFVIPCTRGHRARNRVNDDDPWTGIERTDGRQLPRRRNHGDVADTTEVLERTPRGGMGKEDRV